MRWGFTAKIRFLGVSGFMPGAVTSVLKSALRAMQLSGIDHMVGSLTNNVGVIFMLHHVAPDTNKAFEPNSILRIRPDFLEQVIATVLADGFEVIALDDVPERLKVGARHERPFACFTFDDGYKDNRDFAYPILKRHNLPFTVYVPEQFANGNGDLWWLALEGAINAANQVAVQMDGERLVFDTRSTEQKYAAHDKIYWWLRNIPEDRARAVVADLARTAGFDTSTLCKNLVMNWDELREFAADPLVTIGAHATAHHSLKKLPLAQAREDMRLSIEAIENNLGKPCHHFAYPYGSKIDAGPREFQLARELGLTTAVTTRKGLLQPDHAYKLTSLPRLSLNGDYQDIGLLKTILSGAPFALLNAARAVAGGNVDAA